HVTGVQTCALPISFFGGVAKFPDSKVCRILFARVQDTSAELEAFNIKTCQFPIIFELAGVEVYTIRNLIRVALFSELFDEINLLLDVLGSTRHVTRPVQTK